MFDLTNDEILSLSKEHVFYTWSAQAKVSPIAVKRAKGVYFWDVDGRRYLDFNSMTMCVNIGHGDERVIKAMQQQVAELRERLVLARLGGGPRYLQRHREQEGRARRSGCWRTV